MRNARRRREPTDFGGKRGFSARAGLGALGHEQRAETQIPPIPQIRGLKREGAIAWSAIASAIVRCLGKVHRSPIATSRAAVLPRLGARRRGAGKPITASRSPAQAPQLLQVASEYVAGQIASSSSRRISRQRYDAISPFIDALSPLSARAPPPIPFSVTLSWCFLIEEAAG